MVYDSQSSLSSASTKYIRGKHEVEREENRANHAQHDKFGVEYGKPQRKHGKENKEGGIESLKKRSACRSLLIIFNETIITTDRGREMIRPNIEGSQRLGMSDRRRDEVGCRLSLKEYWR